MKLYTVLFIALLMCLKQLSAQNEIIVNAQVLPPYSPYISTYVDQPNKLKLTLINTSPTLQRIRLWVRIAGDNGVSGTTNASFKPAQAIELQPGGVKNIDFSSPETKSYFDANNVDLVGITKNQLIQNQALPEGTYTICVKALDYLTGAPRSQDGAGCTAPFQINYIDPPLVVQPTCGNDVLQSAVQNVIFSWTPPATAPGTIQYEFTLKEVPNTMNPMDVIKNQVFPVLYNTTITAQNVLVYTNALPQLLPGKKYVWRVRAKDSMGKLQFKNQGFSEPCFFTYKASSPVPTSAFTEIANTVNIPNLNPPTLGGSNAGNPFQFGSTTYDKIKNPNLFAVPTATLSGKLVYKYADPGEQNKEYPMKSANLTLKVGFFQQDADGSFTYICDIDPSLSSSQKAGVTTFSEKIKNKYGVALSSIAATTKTDQNGNYNFSFPNEYPFGSYGDVSVNVQIINGQVGGQITTGNKNAEYSNTYILAYIELEGPHDGVYTQPLQLFDFGTQSNLSNEKVVSMVRSQEFVAHLGPDMYNSKNNPAQVAAENFVGVKAYLLRKTLASADYFPQEDAIGMPEEGDAGKSIAGLEVVASTITDNNGNAKFKRVVRSDGYNQNYAYYIYFEPSKDDKYNYELPQPQLIFASGGAPKNTPKTGNDNYELRAPYCTAKVGDGLAYNKTINAKYSYKSELRNWILKPKMPRVFGRVLDGDNNGKPIEGAYLMLQSNYSTTANYRLFTSSFANAGELNLKNSLNNQSANAKEITYRSTNTNLGGGFSFDDLPIMYDNASQKKMPVGPKRGLLVIKKGYEVYENMPATGFWSSLGNASGIKTLYYGEQYSAGDIVLKRQSEIKGKVVDESGNGVTAYVRVGNDETAEKTNTQGYFKEVYARKISGQKQQIIIEANGFLNDTVLLEVKNAVHDIGTIKLAKRKRVLTVIVQDAVSNSFLSGAKVEVLNVTTSCPSAPTISGSGGNMGFGAVTVSYEKDCPLEATTSYGYAKLKFENGGMDDNIVYQLRITGPTDEDYETFYVSSKIPYSAGSGKILSIKLQPAVCMSGVVKDDKGNKLKGALVKMEQTVPFMFSILPVGELETTTDNNGNYKLRNVPIRTYKQKITATLPGSNLIGATVEVTTKSTPSTPPPPSPPKTGATTVGMGSWSNTSYTIINKNTNYAVTDVSKLGECLSRNFVLKEFSKMDITSLLGFPIEVTDLKDNGAEVKISGNFLNLSSNTQFAPREKTTLAFANVTIKPGSGNAPSGKPVAVPTNGNVKTDVMEAMIKAGYYNAVLRDDSYISVKRESDKTGSISGNVKLETTSMNNNDIAFDEAVYVGAPYQLGSTTSTSAAPTPGLFSGANYNTAFNFSPTLAGSSSTISKKPVLTVFYSDASKKSAYTANDGFTLCDSKGEDVNFSFSSFTKSALAVSKASRLNGNDIILSTILNTNIEGLSPANMKIAIGEVKLTQGKMQGEQKTYYSTISSKMGANWNLTSSKWKVDQFGLNLLEGKIQTGIDIPFEKLIITPTTIRTDQAIYKFDKLTLVNGKLPLAVNAENLALGYFYMEDGVSRAWQFSAYNMNNAPVSEIKGLDGIPTGQSVKLKSIFMFSNKTPSVNMLPASFNVHNIMVFTPSPKMVLNKNSFKLNGTFRTDIPGTGDITSSLFYDETLKVGIDISPFNFKTGNIYYEFDKAKISNKYFFAEGKVYEPNVLPSLKIELEHFGIQNTAVKLKAVSENIIKSAGSGGLKNLIGGNIVSKTSYKWDTLRIEGTTFGTAGINDKKMKFDVTGAVVANDAEIGVDNIETPFGNMKWVYLMQEGALDGSMVIKGMDVGGLVLNGSLNSRIGAKGWYFKAAGQVDIPNLGAGAMYALIGNYSGPPSGDLAEGIGNFGCLPAEFQNKVNGFLFQGSVAKSIADVSGDILVAKGGVKVNAILNARIYGTFTGTKVYGLGLLANVNATAFLESPATCTSVDASAKAEAMVTGTYATASKTLTLDGCISLAVKGSLYQCLPVSYVCPPLCAGDDVSKALGINVKIDSNKNFKADAFFGTCTGNACKVN